MSYTETKLRLTVWTARCDVCGASAGQPSDSKAKAFVLAEKYWGFTRRGSHMCCAEEACRIAAADALEKAKAPK